MLYILTDEAKNFYDYLANNSFSLVFIIGSNIFYMSLFLDCCFSSLSVFKTVILKICLMKMSPSTLIQRTMVYSDVI